MNRQLRAVALAAASLALALVHAAPAAAQSDILLRLRSGTPLTDRLRADSAGGLVAIGQLGVGIIPATGCGYRLMWHPFKAAFRAGSAGVAGCPAAATAWDDANVGFFSWAGGSASQASSSSSFAFGDQVVVSGVDATGFGGSNLVSGTAGFSGGASNKCTGFTCVAFGFTANSGGQGSVAIGYRVTANADYAVALGYRATAAAHSGTFTWADESTTDSMRATANNQFSTRAAGGYRLTTNAAMTLGAALAPNATAWTVISDRSRKENFGELDGEDVLLRIRAMPVQSWTYIDDDTHTRHIGPMAQDWHAAWHLNDDDRTINSADFDGVNLAAIRALEARTAQVAQLRAELAAAQSRMDAMEAALRLVQKARK